MIDDYRSLRGYGVAINELKKPGGDKGHRQELEAFHWTFKGGPLPIAFWDLHQTAEAMIQAQGGMAAQAN